MEEILMFIGGLILLGFFAVIVSTFLKVAWFRWLVIIGVGLYIYFKWIYPRIQEKKEEKQFERAHQLFLEQQKKEEEAEQAIQTKKNSIRSEMESLKIYELDILPFLNVIGAGRVRSEQAISQCIIDVKQQYSDNEKTASMLNAAAEVFEMTERISIHSK